MKLTIRALTDLAKSHSEAIREIERVLPLKVLINALNVKDLIAFKIVH